LTIPVFFFCKRAIPIDVSKLENVREELKGRQKREEEKKMDTVERGPIQKEKEKGTRTDTRDGDTHDIEKAGNGGAGGMLSTPVPPQKDLPPLKGLSFLDRFLVVWIILAMGIGIALGNTVDSVGPALQRGEFVGVSIPIGRCPSSHFSILSSLQRQW
jgi:hypothetical protein